MCCTHSCTQGYAPRAGENEAAEVVAAYVPSPLDPSLLYPQLIAMGFLGICLAYWQLILVPTAQVKFNLADKEKRALVKDIMNDESRPVKKWFMSQWLKPMARPRGDQTQFGAGIVGTNANDKQKCRGITASGKPKKLAVMESDTEKEN